LTKKAVTLPSFSKNEVKNHDKGSCKTQRRVGRVPLSAHLPPEKHPKLCLPAQEDAQARSASFLRRSARGERQVYETFLLCLTEMIGNFITTPFSIRVGEADLCSRDFAVFTLDKTRARVL
jgi:hypothetical protein